VTSDLEHALAGADPLLIVGAPADLLDPPPTSTALAAELALGARPGLLALLLGGRRGGRGRRRRARTV